MHVHHAILYISLPSLHHYNMKLPNFTSPLYGVGEHNTKIVAFFFLNVDNDRYGPKDNFAKICQIKWNWIRSVNFEVVRIDFFKSDFIGFFSVIQKFCYHGNVT